MDESSFGKWVQTNYSWLSKWPTSPIVNAKWIGRTNLIFELWNNGRWMENYSKWKWNSIKFWNLLDIFEELYSELAQIWRPTLLSDFRQSCDSFNRVSKEVSKNNRYRAKISSIIHPKIGTSRNGLRSMKEKDLKYEKQLYYWFLKTKWKKNFC